MKFGVELGWQTSVSLTLAPVRLTFEIDAVATRALCRINGLPDGHLGSVLGINFWHANEKTKPAATMPAGSAIQWGLRISISVRSTR